MIFAFGARAAKVLIAGWMLSCLMMVTIPASGADATGEAPRLSTAIRERSEWLLFGEIAEVSGVRILAPELLAELYGNVAHEPLWQSRPQIETLWELADRAHAEGLDTRDYPLEALRALLPSEGLPDEPIQRAEVDLLATEIFLRVGYQLRFGKVNPVRHFAEWNFERALLEGGERVDTILNIIGSDDLVAELDRITARGPIFDRFIAILAELRALEAMGGWSTVTEGPALRPGDQDHRVVEIRQRMKGSLSAGAISSPYFDEALGNEVRVFQERHGLDADGIVGRKTIAAMNQPVSHRIRQVRASIERARWVFHDFRAQSGPVALVNVAAAEVALAKGAEIVWSSRAQVGKPYRQTPVFRGDIQYLEFNPTWTVPPTILRKDVLPRLRQEGRDYLETKHMDLLDRDGNLVNLDGIDLASIGRDGFPYILRQRPGPWNALGMVKFIFPNPHFVFLHDTPSRQLFDRSERAFSSGCIRVENPFELAELLLDDSTKWNQQQIAAVIDAEKTKVVHLSEQVPVYLLYWTAMFGESGESRFYQDVYGRDAVLFAAMDADPKIDLTN